MKTEALSPTPFGYDRGSGALLPSAHEGRHPSGSTVPKLCPCTSLPCSHQHWSLLLAGLCVLLLHPEAPHHHHQHQHQDSKFCTLALCWSLSSIIPILQAGGLRLSYEMDKHHSYEKTELSSEPQPSDSQSTPLPLHDSCRHRFKPVPALLNCTCSTSIS